jgi:hypothetical protein
MLLLLITSAASLVLIMFVVVPVMPGYVMATILLQHLLTLTLNRGVFVFAHSSDGEIQGLFFMWAVTMKSWWLLQ